VDDTLNREQADEADRDVDVENPRPPSVGPIAGPSMMAKAYRPIAMPCSWGGNVSRKMACSVGWSEPAPRPCRMRKKTSVGSVRAAPQKNDPMRNVARPIM
jgi:hypothetical protein